MEGKNMSNNNTLQPNITHQHMLGLDLHHHHHQTQTQSQTQQQQFFPFTSQKPQHQQPFQAKPTSLQSNPPPLLSPSPWQRMKWTDTMVRVLIMVVYYIDESSSDHPSSSGEASGTATKKPTNHQQTQKKGKWKSVSRAMLERGYNVSPQQCEDKFNDLNKRYKRVNDILGKGTACKVVENQALLEEMDGLSVKDKEEVRKLLNSKHLFFREMCAYHTSCAAAAAASGAVVEMGGQPCFHAPSHGRKEAGDEEEGMIREVQEDCDEDYDDDYEDEEEELHSQHRQNDFADEGEEDEENKAKTSCSGIRKRHHTSPQPSSTPPGSPSPSQQQQQLLKLELTSLSGSLDQQKQWLRRRATELEERKVAYQQRALELERQRFKWQRFSGNKEREMEKMKLENERLRLDSERMLLLLRQKELDIGRCGGGGGGIWLQKEN